MITLPFPAESPYPRGLRLWEPVGVLKGSVVISHGMAEHIGRYSRLADRLSHAGYAVFGYNHLGHGDEAPVKGYFADEDGWGKTIGDLDAVIHFTRSRVLNAPVILLGHSMGSFIAREYVLRNPKGADAMVLSGTGWHPKPLCGFGRLAASTICAAGDPKASSEALDRLAFSANNKPFRPARTAFDWLSRDEAEVDKYADDPLCGFIFTAGGFRDLFSGLYALTQRDRFKALPEKLPVYLISGAADPVGGQGRGVHAIAGQYRKAGLQDVKVRLYEGARHELFNETNREDVCRDLIAWLNASLPPVKGEPA
ncbi:MAG: lysophospholipase [Eubacteriales bacterium]|nr:lysophospholipase [Eubacteriales bacterium]